MDDNLYSAPRAEAAAPAASAARFYVVSVRKFLIMTVATYGYYIPYWFYRNWREINASTGARTWPVMRGLFSLFFVHRLAALLRDALQARGLPPPARLGLMASGFSGVQLTTYIRATRPEKAGDMPMELFFMLMIGGVISMLLPFQRAINAACGDPEGASNDRLSRANLGWIALGVVWWALAIITLLNPEMQQG